MHTLHTHHTVCVYTQYIRIQYNTYDNTYLYTQLPLVHLYTHNNIPPLPVQIVVEEFLEDINNMLNSGEVSVLRVHWCVQDPLRMDHVL